MIRWILVSWAANAVALGVTGLLLHGVTFHHSFWTLIFAAAVFGVLNTILKPILKLLTLPLAVITLGIAWFFVSMAMLWLTTLIVGKFDIEQAPAARGPFGYFLGEYEGLTNIGNRFASVFIGVNNGNPANSTDAFFRTAG